MSDPQEPKNLVLVKLDQVLERINQIDGRLYAEMFQVKLRLSAVERQVASLHEAVVQQWASLDTHSHDLRDFDERLRKLEKQNEG